MATEPKAAQGPRPGPFASPAVPQPGSAEGHPHLGCAPRTGKERCSACTGAQESPVVPMGGFLLSLHLFRSSFFAGGTLPWAGERGRAIPRLLRASPTSFARCQHLARPPPPASHPLAQKLNDFEASGLTPLRCLIEENVKICADEATINGRFDERLKQPSPEGASACGRAPPHPT